MRKLTLGLLCVAVASAILSGCGGSGGSGSQSLLPSELSVPITRGRLIQHGDEYEYVITGTAFYQNARCRLQAAKSNGSEALARASTSGLLRLGSCCAEAA